MSSIRGIKVKNKLILLLTIELLSLNCFGQTEDYLSSLSLEDLLTIEVSIASTNPETIFNSVSTVSIITDTQIKQYGFNHVSEAVATIAGVDIARTYLKHSLPTVRGILQDHYANKVLVMINGTPSWHAITGEGNLERINMQQIKRIEVLKGPASVLYGTNAFSGAINIILFDGNSGRSGFFAGIGTDNQHMMGASYYSQVKNKEDFWSISAFKEEDNRKGFSFIDELGNTGVLDDYIDSQNFTLQGSYGNHEILVNSHKNDEAFLGVAPKFSSGAGNHHTVEGTMAAYKYKHQLPYDASLIFKTKYDWNRRVFSRSADNSIQSNAWGQHWAAELKYNGKITDIFGIELGADYDFRKAKEYINFNARTKNTLTHNNLRERDVSSYSLFTQVNYHKDKLKWLLGVRNVNNELFGYNTSARSTLVYQASETSSIKFIVGQSYRSPSLFELYFSTDSFTVFGNPKLQPEQSTSYEFAYLKTFDNLFLQANVYHASYKNKIFRIKADVTLPDGSIVPDTNVYANGNEFSTSGVELEMHYNNQSYFDAFLNLNFIDGDDGDRQTGTDHFNFKYVPGYTVSAGISRTFGPYALSSIIDYRDETGGPQTEVDSYFTANLVLSHRFSVSGYQINHQLKLGNVFNEQGDIAEYVRRRGPNQLPIELGRTTNYEISFSF